MASEPWSVVVTGPIAFKTKATLTVAPQRGESLGVEHNEVIYTIIVDEVDEDRKQVFGSIMPLGDRH